MTRTRDQFVVQLGRKPQRVADVEKAVIEGMDAVLATARPGKLAHDVEAAWRAAIAKHGLKKESRIGYSIGVGFPPDWGEHTISLRQGNTTVLEAGHVLHAILGMWMDDWGYELSETFRVTPNGAECFTSFERRLIVKS